MSRLYIPEPSPTKKRRSPKKRPVHPEARVLQIRERAAEDSARLESTGWHYPFGWRVHLYGATSRVHLEAPTYQAAVELRDEQMRTGKYEKAWLELRNE